MKSFRFVLLVFACVSVHNALYAQYPLDHKRDWQWRFGYDDGPPDWGLSKVDFSSGAPVSTYDTVPFWFDFANASISDTSGQLLFYSNGARVANRFEQETPNGDSIGCCFVNFDAEMSSGSPLAQSILMLPWPDHPEHYVLFKKPVDYASTIFLYNPVIQYNVLDAAADSGNGDILLKNEILLTDTLSNNGFAACRHANGRDWWIVARRFNEATFHTILLDPFGVTVVGSQTLDIPMPALFGQNFFTPNGNTLVFTAIYDDFSLDTAYVYTFDFNRCNGGLANPQRVWFPSDGSASMSGSASPNSRFVYASMPDRIYQFDLQAQDLLASQTLVATYDGFLDSTGSFPKPTSFNWHQLGPDGKVYIAAGNTSYLHVIENPDAQGAACNVNQHGFHLSALNNYSMPNFPNFRLGPVDGSSCDTLGIDVVNGVEPIASTKPFTFDVFPNPASDYAQLTWNGFTGNGFVNVCEPNGRVVLTRPVNFNRTMTPLELKRFAPSIYLVKLVDESNRTLATRKLVIAR